MGLPDDRRRDDQAKTSEGACKKTVSRREFIKVAGIAGATVAFGGLGASLVGCGDDETATPAQQGSAGETGSEVSAAAEMGREIKLGFVSPATGALASFGAPDEYCVERWREAIGEGVVCGDGRKHPLKIIVKDSQSDSNRSSQVAGDLIANDNVDIMLCSSAPENANPVADQCETNGIPCISTQTPWQAFFFGRNGDPAVGFKWTYNAFVGVEDIVSVNSALWESNPANRVVAGLWPNDTDGNVFRPVFTELLDAMGYTLVDPGAFQPGLEDYTAEISQFKKAGAEIVAACMEPADFSNFWKQAKQQGFDPKVASIAKAILFPESVEALGDIAVGLTSEVAWHPAFPFKSSLTGETCQMVADEYEKRNDRQWTIPLLHYIVGEMAIRVLEGVSDVDDKASIAQGFATLKMDTLAGPIDFSAPVAEGTLRPVPNICKTPLTLGQWRKGEKWPYDLILVNNAAAPMVTVQDEALPLP